MTLVVESALELTADLWAYRIAIPALAGNAA